MYRSTRAMRIGRGSARTVVCFALRACRCVRGRSTHARGIWQYLAGGLWRDDNVVLGHVRLGGSGRRAEDGLHARELLPHQWWPDGFLRRAVVLRTQGIRRTQWAIWGTDVRTQ